MGFEHSVRASEAPSARQRERTEQQAKDWRRPVDNPNSSDGTVDSDNSNSITIPKKPYANSLRNTWFLEYNECLRDVFNKYGILRYFELR